MWQLITYAEKKECGEPVFVKISLTKELWRSLQLVEQLFAKPDFEIHVLAVGIGNRDIGFSVVRVEDRQEIGTLSYEAKVQGR